MEENTDERSCKLPRRELPSILPKSVPCMKIEPKGYENR